MSTSRAIPLAAILLLGNCPSDHVDGDTEADAMEKRVAALLDADRHEEARTELSAALTRFLARGDHAAASRATSLLSRLHQDRNEYRDAIRLAARAVAEAALVDDETALASAFVAMGETLARVGDHTAAIEAYDQAAPHLRPQDSARHARLAIYRALSMMEQGRRGPAQAELERAHDLARATGEHRLVVAACVNLADIALSTGRLDEAERYLHEARSAQHLHDPGRVSPGALLNESVLARRRGDLPAAARLLDDIPRDVPPDTAWLIAMEHGRIEEASGQLDDADLRYREAVRIIERERAESAPEARKAPFLEQRWEAYSHLFALRLRRGDARGAFETMAQAQGQMFLDALAVSLSETRPLPRSGADGAIDRIDVIEQVAPPLARSPMGPAGSIDETLAALRGKHILAYFPAGDHLRMMAVVDGQPRATSVDIDLKELDRLIDDFRARPDQADAAEALGRALLPPEALPQPQARLHVVPVAPLLRVPFAALRVDGARLLDRHEIVYAPSVTGLAAMASEPDPPVGPGLVLADTRSDLDHAVAESRVVVELTGAAARVGPEATRASLRQAVNLSLLHVVSHSGLGVLGGYLVLTDGEATAVDILSWRIRPALVVLPTCSSAATLRSEMWDSLAAAFLAAGSRHVVATVSAVEDTVALEFTRIFYRERGASDPVGGLTRTLRQMAAHSPVSSWSAFVVAGL